MSSSLLFLKKPRSISNTPSTILSRNTSIIENASTIRPIKDFFPPRDPYSIAWLTPLNYPIIKERNLPKSLPYSIPPKDIIPTIHYTLDSKYTSYYIREPTLRKITPEYKVIKPRKKRDITLGYKSLKESYRKKEAFNNITGEARYREYLTYARAYRVTYGKRGKTVKR